MALFERAKNILFSPKTEWAKINTETETQQSLLMKYVIPMLLIPSVCQFIGFGLIGQNITFVGRVTNMNWGIAIAVETFISGIIGYFISSFVVDALATNFSSEKNIGKSAQLVAYSSTAAWVLGITYLLPGMGILMILALYGIYLFYLGMPILKKTPEDKVIVYMLVCALVMIVIYIIVGMILMRIMVEIIPNPYVFNLEGLQNMFK